VLPRSHFLARIASGDALACNYTINGHDYTIGYYFVDGIYPDWETFVKTMRLPDRIAEIEIEFAKAQEAARKDIERSFGVFQARFAIVRDPRRFWDKETFNDIITTCVILHNMIIEDEMDLNLEFFFDNVGIRVKPSKTRIKHKHFLRHTVTLSTRGRTTSFTLVNDRWCGTSIYFITGVI
jgi:hypothetical protein